MKRTIKQTWFFTISLFMAPLTLSYLLFSLLFRGDQLLASYSQFLSLIPGKFGCYSRAGFYYFVLRNCDWEVVISFLTIFSQRDTEIETGVYIGPQCNIGKCRIQKNTLIGSGVHVMSGKFQHGFQDLETPIKDQEGNYEKVSIGEDSWIGNGALIMANIGRQCIIGAGSVVTDDIPDYSIAAGNPAVVLKSRLDKRT